MPAIQTPEVDPGRPRIIAVSVALAAPLRALDGRSVLSGIAKRPVDHAVQARPLGLAGDEQADLQAHGGLRKAVYAYPQEHLPFWSRQRQTRGITAGAEPIAPGFIGENLLLTGLLERDLWVGDTLTFEGSSCVLRITQPREPCYKLCAVMGFAQAAQVMAREKRTGFYMAVDTEGELQAGMAITVTPGQRGLSLTEAIGAKWAKQRNW